MAKRLEARCYNVRRLEARFYTATRLEARCYKGGRPFRGTAMMGRHPEIVAR